MKNEVGFIISNSLKNRQMVIDKLISMGFFDAEAKESCDKSFWLIFVLGGDGMMLRAIHRYGMLSNVLLYGINLGNVGFLLNRFRSFGEMLLLASRASKVRLRVLAAEVHLSDGTKKRVNAVNELSILRTTHNVSRLKILVNDKIYMNSLTGDGVIVSTPAGSSAYNFSAGGPILPLSANLLSMTPVNPYRPRRWSGALLPDNSKISIKRSSLCKTPLNAVADYFEFQDIQAVDLCLSENIGVTLLFDSEADLETRLLNEQFRI